MPLAEAVAELRRSSGTQFDPQVVDALIRSLDGYGASEPMAAPPKIELSIT
jgi:HD-GYP domain-containing protein (c-di-GMP phosphodiesterase class II)